MSFDYIFNILFKDNNLFVQFNKLNDQVNTVNQSVNNVSNTLSSKLNRINLEAISSQIERVGTGLVDLATPGITFQKSMQELSAITGIAGSDLDQLGKNARKIGIDSGLGAAQAAESYKILASNIDVAKIGMGGLNEIQTNTITLAKASGLEIGQAAQALAGTINQFGLDADQANRVINVLAAGSKFGAAEIPELAQSFKVVGAAANAAGLNVESTAGAIEVLSKNNLKGAEAGTALRNIILKMQTELGVDFSKMSLSDALDQLKPKLNDATYLSKLFGMENVASAQFLITNAGAVDEMTQKVTGSNVATEQAQIMSESWADKMAIAKARIDDVKIGLSNLTGGSIAYVAAMSDVARDVANFIPILGLLKQGYDWLRIAQNREMITSKLSAAWKWIVAGATGAWTIAQYGLNVALSANPIGVIVLAIAALIAIIATVINYYDQWGAAATLLLGPLGLIINLVQSFRRHWDSIKAAFTEGGFVAGIKRIGFVLIDAMLMPIQQLLELVAKIPGLEKLAGSGAKKIADLRAGLDKATYIPVKEKVEASQKAIGTNEQIQQQVAGGSNTNLNLNTGAKNSQESIATGGTRNTSINMHIKNMVEKIMFNGSTSENRSEIERNIAESILRALNMAQSSVS